MTPCDDPYPWLSEFLCAYVDGEMPPAEQAAFDERLRGDARLAAHVARLVQTRRLCCGSTAPKAPCDFVAALHRRLAAEGLEAPVSVHLPGRRGTTRRTTAPTGSAEAYTSALLVRSALLLLVLSAVTIARFGLYAHPDPRMAATDVIDARAALALASAPQAESASNAPAMFVARRPAVARLATPLAEPRRPVVRSVYAPTSDALLRIRAAR